jgi:hypothetical protein
MKLGGKIMLKRLIPANEPGKFGIDGEFQNGEVRAFLVELPTLIELPAGEGDEPQEIYFDHVTVPDGADSFVLGEAVGGTYELDGTISFVISYTKIER